MAVLTCFFCILKKGQTQVDVNGNKVGSNRPDVQYDENGHHVCVEFDTKPENGLQHQQMIQANDPNAKVILKNSRIIWI